MVCGTQEYDDEHDDVLLNPIVLIEIVSDSTEAHDRGDKFSHYRQIPSFLEYILVSQYLHGVEKFSRQRDDTWIYSAYDHLELVVRLDSVGCELPLSEIYRKVSLGPRRSRQARTLFPVGPQRKPEGHPSG